MLNMRSLAGVLLGVSLLTSIAEAYPRPVVAMESHHVGIFLQSPLGLEDETGVAQWILASDLEDTCQLRYASWRNGHHDPNGYEIEGKDNAEGYFLSRWDVVYARDRRASDWEVVGPGAWVSVDEGWTRAVSLESGEVATRHLLWQGERSTFFNDPRETEARRGVWYRLGTEGECSVFRETSHTYGPFGIETVELSPGLDNAPGWTLTGGSGGTGGAREVGNWLP